LVADYQKFHPEAVNTIACPLCLTEFGLENVAGLSREPVVPSKLGGRSETLTCRRKCNNTHGTLLDSHLVNAMRAMDAVEGVVPIPTVLGSGKGKIVAELFLPSGPEPDPFRIQIVGKASNMEATDDLRNNLRDGFTLNMQMSFAFTPERYFRAAFRAAFLSVFKVEGFEYALSEGAGQVRQMLNAETPVLEKVPLPMVGTRSFTSTWAMTRYSRSGRECRTVLCPMFPQSRKLEPAQERLPERSSGSSRSRATDAKQSAVWSSRVYNAPGRTGTVRHL
jgi:hypothetical protein